MGCQYIRKLGILSILLLINSSQIKADEIGDLLNKTVECMKYLIHNGFDLGELHIPGFARIEIGDFNLDGNEMISGRYTFKQTDISGLDNFTLEEFALSLHDFSIEFSIKLHGLSFAGNYDFAGRLFDIVDLRGIGDFDFRVGVRMSGSVEIDLIGGEFIKNVDITPTSFPQMSIEGLTVGKRMSLLISKQLNAIITDVFNMEEAKELLQQFATVILRTLWKLLQEIDGVLELLKLLTDQCPNMNAEQLLFVNLKQLLKDRLPANTKIEL